MLCHQATLQVMVWVVFLLSPLTITDPKAWREDTSRTICATGSTYDTAATVRVVKHI